MARCFLLVCVKTYVFLNLIESMCAMGDQNSKLFVLSSAVFMSSCDTNPDVVVLMVRPTKKMGGKRSPGEGKSLGLRVSTT